MASLLKNTASQYFTFSLISSTGSGAGSTSTSTSIFNSNAFLSTGTVQSSLAGSFTALGSGQWAYTPTQSETNYNSIGFMFVPSNCVPFNVHFFTDIGVPTVSSSGAVTVGTNNDKTGYSLAQSFPTNFANLAISSSGAVTIGTNNDKTGYSLTQAFPANFSSLTISSLGNVNFAQTFPANFSSLAITGGGAVTVGTNLDKTGYSLSQAFPSNFASLLISGGGAVTIGTNNDKTGYSLTQSFPANFASMLISTAGRLSVLSNVTQAQTQSGPFTFPMTVAGLPTTGLPVTGQVCPDGVNLNALTNSVSEVGKGLYSITLTSADLNGPNIMLRFSAPGADDRDIFFATQP